MTRPDLPWSDPESDPIGDLLRWAEIAKAAPAEPVVDIVASHPSYLAIPHCLLCGRPMVPVHGHYECRRPGGCGWRDSCCDDGEQR